VTVLSFFPTATPFACAFCCDFLPLPATATGPVCFLTDRFRIEGGEGTSDPERGNGG
jgi:hypothetical protein